MNVFGVIQYFSADNGGRILQFSKNYIDSFGLVLDYGCGPGGLIRYLLNEGISCQGLDFSPEAIDIVKREWGEHPSFRGAICAEGLPTPIDSCIIDTLFCIELIEHLTDVTLRSLLQEFFRVIKPGGYIVITTPNKEDMKNNETICPECGCLYHRYQHARSFDSKSLENDVNIFGFETVVCQPVSFRPKSHLSSLFAIYRFLTRVQKPKLPHLVYIGRKKTEKLGNVKG